MALQDRPPQLFDRLFEWESLARFHASDSPDVRLGVVSERRRQGKTFLLQALCQAVGGFYFTATEATPADSLRELGAALAQHAQAGAPYRLTDWDDAVRVLFTVVPEGLIVIDEFPHLTRSSPELPSVLQRALDPRGSAHQGSRARLLLCGSALSVMGQLLAGQAPLRGRAGLELVVNPFDYRTAAAFWELDDPRLAILVHSIVGGTPAYRRAFVNGDAPSGPDDFDDWVGRAVLNPAMPLFREARYLLAEEIDIREPALYHSVLAAIAGGNTTRGGIASAIGRKSTDLAHPLAVLEDCALISHEVDPFHAKRSTYRITEPLVTFYEAIMRSRWTLLEQRQTAVAWQDARPRFLAQVVGPHFEELCRAWARGAGIDTFGGLPAQVASTLVDDAAGRGQLEVDVAVLTPAETGGARRVLSLGEAKWGEVMGPRHLERLRRARDLLTAKGHDTRDTVLTCYGGAGFDPTLVAAGQAGEVMLVDAATLYE